MKYKKICYLASKKISNSKVIKILQDHGICHVSKQKSYTPDLLLVLGGDGFMIKTIHDFLGNDIPIYGINCGNMGFLLNEFDENSWLKKIEDAVSLNLMVLAAEIKVITGEVFMLNAINEVYIMRKSYKALGMRLYIDGEVKSTRLVGDGLIVSTPVGSSAYNYSAGGSIVPADAHLVVLTPINVFRPKGFSSIILPDNVSIKLEASDPIERSMMAVVDSRHIEDVVEVIVYKEKNKSSRVLFDNDKSFTKKMIDEQFCF